MSAGDDGIKVRAVCPAGHETVTTAPKDRVTWRGECHTAGCTHRIVARKVLDTPAEPSTPEPTDPPKPAKKIRKVAAYRAAGTKPDDQPTPAPGFDGQPPAGGGADGGSGPAGVPDAAGGAGGQPSGLIDDTGSRRSVLRRARDRQRQRREQRAAALDDGKPWTIPGIYR